MAFVGAGLQGCMTTSPLEMGSGELTLSECPSLPNCVSTEAEEGSMHAIPAFELAMPVDQAWPEVRQAVAELPNTSIVEEDESRHYLYAKAYSDLFGFVDYFEVLAQPQPVPESGAERLAVRSAAMLGISDMGVNEARAERFREALRHRGVIRP
ncbi:uncharacterized protein (DUF1499 family) [Halospina denitrificans]|uniref:Uncharacterized protein (DUF1499 family) n=1 Tax=Halospina denitrificans TaxID=332522 RepID=A0A4R7JYC0_9GAMM|nr:DUF1499 domain-containing protein [Halospina denitrificans]TDT43511.1 uncharacterized protein (DUF1499 family) [Halospina denitrificans]